jgi:hypothetical protein
MVTRLTAKQIKEKVMDAVLHTAPELLPELPGKLMGYVDLLEGKLEICCDGTGDVVRCEECLETGKVLEDVVTCIRSMKL